jgi:hypothetical protein
MLHHNNDTHHNDALSGKNWSFEQFSHYTLRDNTLYSYAECDMLSVIRVSVVTLKVLAWQNVQGTML